MEREQLWKSYKNGSVEAKNELLLNYISLVKFIVDRIWTGYRIGSFDKEDLTSLGIIGLIDAMEKFDPNLGVKFETYATPRVKGQIIDAIRKEQWLPKDILKGISELEDTIEQLSATNEPLTNEKISETMEISTEKVRKLTRYAGQKILLRLDTPISTQEGTIFLKDTIEDDKQLSPHSAFLLEQQQELLAKVLDKLSDREKLILNLYYNEELTFKEISEILKLSEARISQIHAKAVLRLRRLFTIAQKS
ncbi:FliA/WhiG family RNA polymerase sigma factor [Proteinivorax hydrogeniformans]|uniref:FliA/WhiG family RNA polymerase sigma factor n=1 Tax=Proteinivorax hydrogeniformans TaxID=1826727 RepID=A0AAU8HQ04_9FIRM